MPRTTTNNEHHAAHRPCCVSLFQERPGPPQLAPTSARTCGTRCRQAAVSPSFQARRPRRLPARGIHMCATITKSRSALFTEDHAHATLPSRQVSVRSLHCLPRIRTRGSVSVHIFSFALGVTKNKYGQKPFHKPPRPGTCCSCPRRNMSQMTKPRSFFSVFQLNKYGRVLMGEH